jgi:hypothetical protein
MLRPRLSLFALLVTVACTISGCDSCSILHRLPPASFLSAFREVGPSVIPPGRALELWVEGESLQTDASRRVTRWRDMRQTVPSQLLPWPPRNADPMTGTVSTLTPRMTLGLTRTVQALRCVRAPRCSYQLTDGAGQARAGMLDGQPYEIFAVVARAGSRGDDYPVMTGGNGCQGSLSGLDCTPNTTLHLGWSGMWTIRLGQYGNDVHFEVQHFNPAAPALTLLVGRSDSRGKMLAFLEPFDNQHIVGSDTRLLERSGTLFVGGTPFVDSNPVADWHFEGDILALLVYRAELTEAEQATAANYLRTRYGPR